MIAFRDYIAFYILKQEIILISDDVNGTVNTVAEIGNRYYYLGSETPNILAATLAWQEFNGIELTNEELKQIMKNNDLE